METEYFEEIKNFWILVRKPASLARVRKIRPLKRPRTKNQKKSIRNRNFCLKLKADNEKIFIRRNREIGSPSVNFLIN